MSSCLRPWESNIASRIQWHAQYRVASSSWELTEMLMGGKLGAAILQPDKEGRQRLDFGTYYFVDRSTYMVAGGSRINTIDDVDYRRVRVIAVEGSTTDRAATHASLAPLVGRVPGSRILEGSFERVGLAFAVPRNRLHALDYVTIFTEDAKASGLVQRAFDNAGVKNSQPAKPDSTAPVLWSCAPFLFGLDPGGLGELREHRDFLAG